MDRFRLEASGDRGRVGIVACLDIRSDDLLDPLSSNGLYHQLKNRSKACWSTGMVCPSTSQVEGKPSSSTPISSRPRRMTASRCFPRPEWEPEC
jgi:hypothetical protein